MSRSFEEENEIWDRMLREQGTYKVAQRIAKLPSYKRYIQRWPYDGVASSIGDDVVSLELLYEQADTMVNVEDDYLSGEWSEEFYQALTPKQRAIARLLVRGYSPREILGLPEYQGKYRNTGGIRYYKHAIRKRFRDGNPS